MATVDVYNLKHEKVGSLELDPGVFESEIKEHLFHEVVRAQLASRRAGTQSTKGRAEVRGSGKKPFKQKGTGRARQGDVKNPTHVGGGVAFAPKPRDYSYKPPKKVVRAAVKSALAKRLSEGKLWVVDSLELPEIKTKAMIGVGKAFGWASALLIDAANEKLARSVRNIPKMRYLNQVGLNCYDLLRAEHIVLSRAAVAHITGALSK